MPQSPIYKIRLTFDFLLPLCAVFTFFQTAGRCSVNGAIGVHFTIDGKAVACG
uniref:Uncharacterized protein n=1 Tax=Faecalibaculum rodentium TaxID=1702221 RepID=A0A140DT14_9FIRM|nr:hypothetical protein AALO17_06570 [Faecalibaculum rodentium]